MHAPFSLALGGALAILYICLSLAVIGIRRREQIGFGSGGNERLARRVRGHANFSEYVPFVILLLFMVEVTQDQPGIWWYLAMIFLPLGRLLHAVAFFGSKHRVGPRTLGTVLTITSLSFASLECLIIGLSQFNAG